MKRLDKIRKMPILLFLTVISVILSPNGFGKIATDESSDESIICLAQNDEIQEPCVTGYEYWFDDNSSNPVWVEADPESVSLDVLSDIDKSSLSAGLHYFYLRVKYEDCAWSSTLESFFIILLPETDTPWENDLNTINKYQYWYDDNFADNYLIDLADPSSAVELITGLEMNGLAPGLHFVHIRFLDDSGQWNSPVNNFFIKQLPDHDPSWENLNNKIIKYQYWYDDNFADNYLIDLADPSSAVELITGLEMNGLAPGLHFAHIRFMDESGQWNSPGNNYFIKQLPDPDPPWMNTDNVITSYKFWFDDNVEGAAIVNIPSVINIYELVEDIAIPAFEKNSEHQLHFQFMDIEGQVSCVLSQQFIYVNKAPLVNVKLDEVDAFAGQTVQIAAEATDPNNDPMTYEWSVNEAPSGSAVSGIIGASLTLSFNPDVGGDFVIQFRAYDGSEWSDPDFVTVHSITNRPPVAKCKDVTVEANTEGCSAITTIDDGCYDPDGDQVNIVLDPAPPYQVGTTEVTLTITDPLGESATCMANVTVEPLNPTPVISVDPEYTVTGEAGNTIYLGYGAQSVTLTASGGSEYEWSSVPSGTYQSNSSIVVSPATSTTYTVLVTNDIGCSASASVIIYVYDWRCGKDLRKVKVCHNGKEICIDENAVQAHLDHGDRLGNCRMIKENMSDEEYNYSSTDELSVSLQQNYPNPFAQLTEIQYFVSQREHTTLVLTDINGRIVANLIDKYVCPGWNTLIVNGSGLSAGTYILRLESMGKTAMMKIVKIE